MKYTAKPINVEACRILDDYGDATGAIPSWLMGSIARGRIKLNLDGDSKRFSVIVDNAHTKFGRIGDWIVKEGEILMIMTEAEFKAHYEPTPCIVNHFTPR